MFTLVAANGVLFLAPEANIKSTDVRQDLVREEYKARCKAPEASWKNKCLSPPAIFTAARDVLLLMPDCGSARDVAVGVAAKVVVVLLEVGCQITFRIRG